MGGNSGGNTKSPFWSRSFLFCCGNAGSLILSWNGDCKCCFSVAFASSEGSIKMTDNLWFHTLPEKRNVLTTLGFMQQWKSWVYLNCESKGSKSVLCLLRRKPMWALFHFTYGFHLWRFSGITSVYCFNTPLCSQKDHLFSPPGFQGLCFNPVLRREVCTWLKALCFKATNRNPFQMLFTILSFCLWIF